MALYNILLFWTARINSTLLKFGRALGCAAMVLMVCAILLQVFYRYVLNNALPWPEEAARALMIWMMALVAPSAYRHAGFVSIDFFPEMLKNRTKIMFVTAILLLCVAVIIVMLGHAWAHFSAPLLFDSSGLNRLVQDSGLNQLLGTNIQFRTAYIYLAMSVLLVLMLSVSVELFLRLIGRLLKGEETYPDPERPQALRTS